MANRRWKQFFYSNHVRPVMLNCKFQVLSTNSAGVTGFSGDQSGGFGSASATNTSFGGGIASVLGYSSAPAAGNNMLQGNFLINLADTYAGFFGLASTVISPVTGSAVNVTSGLSLGQVYQIVTLGTTTTAAWIALGVPVGIAPAVGLAFQAATASAGSGTGTVKAIASSQCNMLEVAGDPNLSLTSTAQASVGFGQSPGGYILLSAFKAVALTQPTDGTIIELALLLNGR